MLSINEVVAALLAEMALLTGKMIWTSGGSMTMKELYEDPQSEIIVFEAEDVITTSCSNDSPIELPELP